MFSLLEGDIKRGRLLVFKAMSVVVFSEITPLPSRPRALDRPGPIPSVDNVNSFSATNRF